MERRRNKRYAIGFQLRFTLRGRTVDFSGRGTAINMSSTGLLFRSETTVLTGEAIAAVIDWPRNAEGGTQGLLLHGRVIWCQTSLVAICFSRHAFIPNVGPADPLGTTIRVRLRDAALSTRKASPLILVVENIEPINLLPG